MIFLQYVIRRFIWLAIVIACLILAVFVLQHISPADPIHAMLGAGAPQSQVEAVRHELGYDRPIFAQFASYFGDVIHGDLQDSLRTRRPVVDDLRTYLPATLELTAVATFLALLLGAVFGIVSARARRLGIVYRVVLIALASVPVFLAAQLLVIVFYGWLDILPAAGQSSIRSRGNGSLLDGMPLLNGLLNGQIGSVFDALMHLILPALSVAVLPAVAIGRVLRSSLLDELDADYARTARSKGLSETAVIVRHALRNSIAPALSMAGLQLGAMFAGVLVVEQIFAWPGLGSYMSYSIGAADLPAISGVTIVLGCLYVMVNFVVDSLQVLLDPRQEFA